MKQLYLQLTSFSLLLFSACTQEEALFQDREQPDTSVMLSIQNVAVEDFATESTSRVINDGVTVSFEPGNSLEDEQGDVIGVLLIDEEGKGFANVPFKYITQANQNQWVNKNGVAYTGKIAKAIAYFPYALMEQLPSSVEELKRIKQEMNETETEFKNKDLLVSEIEDVQSHLLTVDFKHAFSLVMFSGENFIEVGDESIPYLLDLSGVAFSIGNKQYAPELANGKYYCLLNENELKENEFRYFYTVNNSPYIKTIKGDKALLSNHSYVFPCPVSSSTGTAGIAPGDFYCTTSGNQVVVLPGNAAAIPEQLTCHGIVFHGMDGSAFGTYATTNELVSNNYPGYNGHHGLMVSVMNGGRFGSATKDDLSPIFTDIEGKDDINILNGYKLTQAVKTAAEQKAPAFFTALEGHAESVKNATSWYLASFGELKYLIQGETLNDGSTAGQEYINQQLNKIAGAKMEGNFPSVTFKSESGGFCLMQNGNEMGWHGIPDGEGYRPICAF